MIISIDFDYFIFGTSELYNCFNVPSSPANLEGDSSRARASPVANPHPKGAPILHLLPQRASRRRRGSPLQQRRVFARCQKSPLRDISPADKRRDAQAGRRGAHQYKINEDQCGPPARGSHQKVPAPKFLDDHEDNLHEIRVPFVGEPDKHGEAAGDDRQFKDQRRHKRALKVGLPQ